MPFKKDIVDQCVIGALQSINSSFMQCEAFWVLSSFHEAISIDNPQLHNSRLIH